MKLSLGGRVRQVLDKQRGVAPFYAQATLCRHAAGGRSFLQSVNCHPSLRQRAFGERHDVSLSKSHSHRQICSVSRSAGCCGQFNTVGLFGGGEKQGEVLPDHCALSSQDFLCSKRGTKTKGHALFTVLKMMKSRVALQQARKFCLFRVVSCLFKHAALTCSLLVEQLRL